MRLIYINIGCVAVGVDGGATSFEYYSSGVLTSDDCGTTMDHAVLVVGYGYDNDEEYYYWNVKNSWVCLVHYI